MKRTKTIMALFVLTAVALFSAGGTSQAVLQDVSCNVPGTIPCANANVAVDGLNGFPLFYIDTNGVALDQCNFSAASPDPNCIPAGPAAVPIPGIDFEEAFWWAADAPLGPSGNLEDALLVLALEAAFATGDPVAGQQIVFGRIRVRANVALAGTYVVTHPFGQKTFIVPAVIPGPEINDTIDGGGGAGDFVAVLGSDIGPFLTCVTPAPPAGYLGNAAVPCTVTGSPTGNNLFNITGPGTNATTNLFTVSGKISTQILPPVVTVESAGLCCDSGGVCTINVAATVACTPGPCDPATTVNISSVPAGSFFGLMAADPLVPGRFTGQLNIPAASQTDFAAVGASVPGLPNAAKQATLLDQVTVSEATFNTATGIVSIKAASCDANAQLFAGLFNQTLPLTGGALNHDLNGTSPAPIGPPPSVTVVSSSGGSASMAVTVVNVPETITPTRKIFRLATKRYNIAGTTSAPGAAVTARLVGGPNDGQIIGTAFADAAGKWTIRRSVTEGAPRPRLTRRISITSSGNASIASTGLQKL